MMRLPSRFRDSERRDSGFKSKLEAGLGIDSMQGMRKNLGQDDGIRNYKTSLSLGTLHGASVLTLIAVRAVLASFHPGRG